jgi:hypothetical protein
LLNLGRLNEARAALACLLAIYRGFTIAEWRALAAPAVAPETQEIFVSGLRLAGLPEE